MQIMGISGMPGSGKSIISDKCVEKGAIIVSMGDIIREEAKKRGETTGETAVNLRKEHGDYIVSELTIQKIKRLLDEGNEKIVSPPQLGLVYIVRKAREQHKAFKNSAGQRPAHASDRFEANIKTE